MQLHPRLSDNLMHVDGEAAQSSRCSCGRFQSDFIGGRQGISFITALEEHKWECGDGQGVKSSSYFCALRLETRVMLVETFKSPAAMTAKVTRAKRNANKYQFSFKSVRTRAGRLKIDMDHSSIRGDERSQRWRSTSA